MNTLFKANRFLNRISANNTMSQLLSNQGAQATIYQDLAAQEAKRYDFF